MKYCIIYIHNILFNFSTEKLPEKNETAGPKLIWRTKKNAANIERLPKDIVIKKSERNFVPTSCLAIHSTYFLIINSM